MTEFEPQKTAVKSERNGVKTRKSRIKQLNYMTDVTYEGALQNVTVGFSTRLAASVQTFTLLKNKTLQDLAARSVFPPCI